MIVLMTIGTPDFTGAAKMAWVVARALKSSGHRVIVVTGRRPPDGHASVIDMLRSEQIETIDDDGFEQKVPNSGLIDRISKIVEREGVQRLISETQQDLKILVFVAKKTGVPLIYHAQNRVFFPNSFVLRFIKKHLYTRMLRTRVSKILCVSESVRNQHLKEFRTSEQKTLTIENGVDVTQFGGIEESERDRLRSEFGVAKDQLFFLNVGRLTYQKGQDLLLRAISKANLAGKDYKLVLVGAKTAGMQEDIDYEKELFRLAEDSALKGRCIFAGWRNDVPKLLQSADAYLHSANWEGLPLAVLEAMAAGLPTVWTDCAGLLAGFIPGVHGYVAKTGDEVSFRSGIDSLMMLTAEQRREMGQAALSLVREKFDSAVTSRRFVEAVLSTGSAELSSTRTSST